MQRANISLAFTGVVALILLVPTASSAFLDSYDLVGEDPAGDARNDIVTGVDNPVSTFSRGKQDIRSIEMGDDGANLHFKLNVDATYVGTSSLLFAIHFKSAGTPYFVCWQINSAGLTSNSADVTENLLGCNRFTGTTQVGPTTRAAGVDQGTKDGKNYVRWEVPKTAIKVTSPTQPITDIVAETWNRGPSTCCAGSTTNSQYLWNLADRAPDTATWTYVRGPKAPALAINLTATPAELAVGPGTTAAIELRLALAVGASTNVTLGVEGLPEGWNVTFEPENATLTAEANETTVLATLIVPSTALNQTLALNFTAAADFNVTASAVVNLTVDTTLAGPASPGGAATTPGGTASNATGTEQGSPAAETDAGIPSIGLIGALAAAAAGISSAIRRRP